jgi:energy-coupling factor transporter ATP-binding protein EcfA2
MDHVVVAVRDLRHRYPNGTEAVSQVSFEIAWGETVGVLGRNGSGKTTMVRLLNGLLQPTSGEVFLLGRSITGRRTADLAKSVGYVFQNPDEQIFLPTVEQEVAFGLRNIGCDQAEIEARTQDVLARLRLEAVRRDHPFRLSRAMRKKLAIACVLAMRPELIILDEPTTGQDVVETRMIMDLVSSFSRAGHTVIMVTHDMRLAAEYCDRLLVMNAGTIVVEGSPAEVFALPDLRALAGVEPPQVAQLGRRLGTTKTILTIDDAYAYLRPTRD